MFLGNCVKHCYRYWAALVLVFLSLFALAGQAFATNGVHTFASPGAASGGFKPQGNHFLVSALFEPDTFPNDTAICYNTTGLPSPAPTTVTGMIIKADGTNLTSFDLTDMKFTMYNGADDTISSLKITGTKSSGGTVSVTVVPGFRAAGTSFTLLGLGANLSAFTGITQLSFDVTMVTDVWLLDFSTITLANEAYPPTVAPTAQATNVQGVVVGSTELNLGWTSGNGTTNFMLPDFRGRTLLHANATYLEGKSGEAETGALTATSQLPAHSHALMANSLAGNSNVPQGNILAAVADAGKSAYATTKASPAATMAPGALSPAGGSAGHNNMQPSLTINCCIALTGIWPSRS
jgi:microcystin-dependent protein